MNPSELTNISDVYIRLGLAVVMGIILGIERDLHHKPAGIRVLALVCVGACVITMASIRSFAGYPQLPSSGILPTIQGILSGIGFFGAGVIMRTQGREEVHGLTTAASIWIAAILGMTSGLGEIALCLPAFVLSWCILVLGRYVEDKVLTWMPRPVPRPIATNSTESSE